MCVFNIAIGYYYWHGNCKANMFDMYFLRQNVCTFTNGMIAI